MMPPNVTGLITGNLCDAYLSGLKPATYALVSGGLSASISDHDAIVAIAYPFASSLIPYSYAAAIASSSLKSSSSPAFKPSASAPGFLVNSLFSSFMISLLGT